MSDTPKKPFWSRLKPKSSRRPAIRHIPNGSPDMPHFAAGEHWATAGASTSLLPGSSSWVASTSLASLTRTTTPTPTQNRNRNPAPLPESVSYNDFGTWVGPSTAPALRQRQPPAFSTWAGETDEAAPSPLRPPPRRKPVPGPWTGAGASSSSTASSAASSPSPSPVLAPSAPAFIGETLTRRPTLVVPHARRASPPPAADRSPPPFTGRRSPASFTSDSTLRSPLDGGLNPSSISIAMSVETVSSVSSLSSLSSASGLSPAGSSEPLLDPAARALASSTRPAGFRSSSPLPAARSPTPPVPSRGPSARSELPASTRELLETCDRLLKLADAYAADLHKSKTKRAEDQARFAVMAGRLRDAWAAERAELAAVIDKVKARAEQQAENAHGAVKEMGGMIERLQAEIRGMQAENEALRGENRRLREREVGGLLLEAGEAGGYM